MWHAQREKRHDHRFTATLNSTSTIFLYSSTSSLTVMPLQYIVCANVIKYTMVSVCGALSLSCFCRQRLSYLENHSRPLTDVSLRIIFHCSPAVLLKCTFNTAHISSSYFILRLHSYANHRFFPYLT